MPHRQTKKVRTPTALEFTLALSAWEGQFVDFKESVSSSLACDIVAFANSNGGRIYIGVADDKSVKGVQISNRLLSQVQSIARHCDPPVTVNLVPYGYKNRGVLIIDVPEGFRKPYGCADGYFLRTGACSQKMNREELIEFVHLIEPTIFERQDYLGFKYPRDFNHQELKTFLRMSKVSSEGLSTEELLMNLGVAQRENSRFIFNAVGVLFFAKTPLRFLPQSRVTCVLFQTPERLHVLDRKDLDGGLLENLHQAEVFLLKHLPVRYEIKGFDRIEHPEFPVEVLREGLVNALMHRDYSVRGGNVFVEVYPDRVAIVNPGGLPPGLSPADFGTKSVHRNPLIADLFFRVGKVEKVGTGIRRMRNLLANAKCLEPQFNFTSFFELTLPRYPTTKGQVGGKWGASGGQVAGEIISRNRVILGFCKTPKSLKQIMVKIGIRKRDHAMPCIKSLIQANLLAPTIPDKPRSRLQKYVATAAGVRRLEEKRQ